MTADPWQEVRRELDRWAHQGLRARFWLRDDDACEMSAQLMRLRALADRFDLNIGLAVIPGKVRPAFVRDVLGLRDRFEPMCHGWNHIDYGRPGMPEEFGDGRPFSTVCRDAEQAYKVFSDCFGASHAIFVPPFNRITAALVNELPRIGFAGVSMGPGTFERRMLRLNVQMPWIPLFKMPTTSSPIPHFNVQIDVIDWKQGTARDARAVAAELAANLRMRRKGFLSVNYPIGLLTHHLVHDEAIWSLCNEVLSLLVQHESTDALGAACLLRSVCIDSLPRTPAPAMQSAESVSRHD